MMTHNNNNNFINYKEIERILRVGSNKYKKRPLPPTGRNPKQDNQEWSQQDKWITHISQRDSIYLFNTSQRALPSPTPGKANKNETSR
jgi:hypothetical protein